jgi:hypothetical protein
MSRRGGNPAAYLFESLPGGSRIGKNNETRMTNDERGALCIVIRHSGFVIPQAPTVRH